MIIPIHVFLNRGYKIAILFFKILYLLNSLFIHIFGSINGRHHNRCIIKVSSR
nr:MAG TPA: hypothetical protein [Caudoviricetes sp.]